MSNKLYQDNDQRTQLLQNARLLGAGTVLCQRFTIQKPLGSGAQASVYKAYDELLDSPIAIKVVDIPDLSSDSVAQVRNEVNIARQLNHPHIINVHELFIDGALTFFTMQLIEGTTLQERLQKPLSYEDFQRWTKQLISALCACKVADVRHGDIKPNNIIIDTNDDLRLIDFGLGRQQQVGSQNSGHLDYSAPEVIKLGLATAQSEVYSLGKVLQELLQAVTFNRATKSASISKSEVNKLNKKLAQLTHSSPNQRPQIDDMDNFIFSPPKRNTTYLAIILVGVALVCGLIIYQFSTSAVNNDEKALDLPGSRLGIVFDNNSVLSANLSTILQTTLIANPSFALVKHEELSQSTYNLGLDPNNIADDRVKLASIYNLDLVLSILVSELNTQQMILSFSLSSMPEDKVIEQFSSSLSFANLNAELIQVSKEILKRVASSNSQTAEEVNWTVADIEKLVSDQKSLNSEQIDMRTAVSKSLAASIYEQAYSAYLNDDLVSLEQSLDELFGLKDAPTYWLLQARLLDADVKNKPELALQSATKLTELFPRRAELLSKRAEIYDWLNEPELAIADYNAAISLSPNDGNLLFNLARLKIIAGQIRQAIEKELTQALVAFRTKGDKTGESLVLNAFGVAHLRLTEYDRALAYFGDSLKLRNALDDPLARATTLSNIANILAIQGDYDGALEALTQAFKLAQEQNDLVLTAHILDTMGLFHEEQGLYSQALDFYKRGLDINTNLGDSYKAKSMNNVAFMHFLIGDFALAEIYWERASELFTAFNDQSHLIRTQQNLVQLALLKGNLNQVSKLIDAISNNVAADQKQEQMILLNLRSKWFFSRGLLPEAFEQVASAKEIANSTKDNRAIIELSLWHAEMCMKILDIVCLASNLDLIETLGNTESTEQAIVYNWLQLGLFNEQIRPAQEKIDAFVDVLHDAKVSEYVKIKIMVDITERFSLASKTQILKVVSEQDLSLYYQEYMNFLFLYPHTETNMDKLAQMLVKYPDYWRNHLFLTSFSDPRSQDKQRKSELKWLSNLSEEQHARYVDRYLNE